MKLEFSRKRAQTWIVTLATALLAALAAAVPASANKGEYVAMGDSYTAGPLIPLQIQPYGCLKSSNNYPHLAAPDLKVRRFTDISCPGAQTKHFTQQQNATPGRTPPQFSALTPETTIVSFTMGGNDIG